MARYTWKSNAARNNCWICNIELADHQKKHCHYCGDIVCEACSSQKMKGLSLLDKTPLRFYYTPFSPMRVCDVCFIPETDNSKKLQMQLARDVVLYLNKVIIRSPTRILVGLENFDGTHEEKQLFIHTADSLFRCSEYFLPEMKMNSKEFIYTKATHCLKYGVGNCFEFAAAAFVLLKEKIDKQNIPYFQLTISQIKNGDHGFLVIGNFGDPFAVICDPWARKKYYWHEHVNKLKSFSITKKGKYFLEDFDSDVHSIVSMYSVDRVDSLKKVTKD